MFPTPLATKTVWKIMPVCVTALAVDNQGSLGSDGLGTAQRDRLSDTFFDADTFHREKQFVVCFELQHPGSELWPFGFLQEIGSHSVKRLPVPTFIFRFLNTKA